MEGGWQRRGVKRRGLIDVYADLLDAIEDGVCKTNIVYKANLNFDRCKRYIDNLAKCGLVKAQTNSPSNWAVTDRGREFLKKHGELRELLPR
ncbi:unnamed protein product [marine sediment metagenome]|uniref:ArnR1-like winged helix-turn-helix domain-containing protein n=1 Tax=marine sediment metagenome TaxID=412755 RepID=X1LG41_9ZZZZ